MNKSEARSYIKNLSIDYSVDVCSLIIESRILDNYKHIGIYYPLNNEISVLPLIKYYNDKCFYFPKSYKNEMKFYSGGVSDLVKGRFNILEPIEGEEVVPEVIITPCVGINLKGYRLGHGMGYYDRYYHKYQNILYIGVCHKKCVLDFLEDSHDLCFKDIFIGE